jgi:hypothetical protein
MNSRTTRHFWKLFLALPLDVRKEAKAAYRLFERNPAHPSLHFKKLEGTEDVYSARISRGHRALAVMRKSGLVWYWIGDHAEYDRLT